MARDPSGRTQTAVVCGECLFVRLARAQQARKPKSATAVRLAPARTDKDYTMKAGDCSSPTTAGRSPALMGTCMPSLARSCPTRPHRLARVVETLLALAILMAWSMASAGCSSSREADVRHARRSPGGTRIALVVGTCHADLRSRVEETDREVRVLVTARNATSGDCADHHEISLSEPLGDRLLVDEFDGEPVVRRPRRITPGTPR